MAKLRITLVKSLIGRKDDHVATAHALGLKRINNVVEHEENAQIKGMVNKIGYLLRVEEI